jgi:hypothetical protein
MRKILTLLVFLVSIPPLLSTAAAQSQPQYSAGLLQRVASLKKTVPNDLIYTIFFKEMAARERFADRLERAGNTAGAADTREWGRQVMQVTPERFPGLKAASLQCAAELASYDQQERSIVETLPLQPRPSDAPPGWKPPELAQLDAQRANAIAHALNRMRETLAAEAFGVTDYLVYRYISVRLHRPGPRAAAGAQKGGR